MSRLAALLGALLLSLAAPAGAQLPAFQDLVDATPDGGILLPPPGVYAGPVVIDRPINIYADGSVVIDNGGAGTVLTLTANHSTISGVVLRNSGDHHTKLDAAMHVRSHFNTIKDVVIEDCLFGIDLSQANSNIVRRNRIGTKDADIGLKGDAIRVWYGLDNRIEDNVIESVRDGILVWYARRNTITGNVVNDSRYGLHLMYAEHNTAENNRFYRDMVGIFSMFANGLVVRGNMVIESNGPSGIALGLKNTSDALIENNTIVSNAVGLYIDTSPEDEEVPNTFRGNRIAYNGIGASFHSDLTGNHITGNDFIGNFSQVAVRDRRSAARNDWDGNHWDDYQGFDRDGDGIGDTPHEAFAYADRIWSDVPATSFFRGSPILELIDFLQRLAPFSEPTLLLRDQRPLLRSVATPPVS